MDGLCGWMTNVTLFPPFSRLVRVDENLLQPREWDPSFLPHTPPRHLLFGDGIYQATCTLPALPIYMNFDIFGSFV